MFPSLAETVLIENMMFLFSVKEVFDLFQAFSLIAKNGGRGVNTVHPLWPMEYWKRTKFWIHIRFGTILDLQMRLISSQSGNSNFHENIMFRPFWLLDKVFPISNFFLCLYLLYNYYYIRTWWWGWNTWLWQWFSGIYRSRCPGRLTPTSSRWGRCWSIGFGAWSHKCGRNIYALRYPQLLLFKTHLCCCLAWPLLLHRLPQQEGKLLSPLRTELIITWNFYNISNHRRFVTSWSRSNMYQSRSYNFVWFLNFMA